MDRSTSSVTSLSKPLQTSTFCHLISMDHKRSISLLISSLGVNMLFHRNGNTYPTTKNPIETNLTTSHDSSQKLNKDSR
jgi:hypothetical protein